jgi:hypothetical protein
MAVWAHEIMNFMQGIEFVKPWNIIQSACNDHFSSIHIQLVP